MSEKEFMVFQNVMAVAETIWGAGYLMAFLYPFIKEKRTGKESVYLKIGQIILMTVIYLGISFLGMTASDYSWVYMVLVILLLTVLAPLYGMERPFAFLLMVLFFSICRGGMLMMNGLFFLFDRYKGAKDSASEVGQMLQNTAQSYLITDILQMILIAVMLYIASRKIVKRSLPLHGKEMCFLSLLPVVEILFGEIVVRLFVMIKGKVIVRIYEQYPVFLILIPLLGLFFYITIMIMLYSYQEMLRMQEEKKRYFVEEQQLRAIQDRREEADRFYEGIRRMKHEMKNHLMNIKGLAENGSYEEMEAYIHKMDQSMSAFEPDIKTGNIITDIILNDKQKRAKKQNTGFTCEFCYPDSQGYDPYDMGIILSNLLENALEACQNMTSDNRHIRISGRQSKKFFLIEACNTFEGEVTMDSYTSLPLSTKEKDNSFHGIGLSNVRNVVEKYMGDMDIRLKKGEFQITVLLQEKNEERLVIV